MIIELKVQLECVIQMIRKQYRVILSCNVVYFPTQLHSLY